MLDGVYVAASDPLGAIECFLDRVEAIEITLSILASFEKQAAVVRPLRNIIGFRWIATVEEKVLTLLTGRLKSNPAEVARALLEDTSGPLVYGPL